MKLKTAFLPALALALALPALTSPARAQAVAGAPAFVDYQGVVFDGTTTTATTSKPLGSVPSTPTTDPVTYVAAPTNYTMQFKIYDAQSGGTLIWAETQTVTVSLGAFAVRLGSGASISGLSPTPTQTSIGTAFNGKDRFLELTVIVPPASTGTPITPRLAFQSSPFSLVAQRAKLADEVNGRVTADSTSTFAGGTFTGGTFGSLAGPATFVGDGTGLTTLNAGNVSAGTLGDARLSSNVALLSRNPQAFTGATNSFSGKVGIGTTAPTVPLNVVGTNDATLANGSGVLVIGPEGGENIVMDTNEIQGRNAGIASNLYLSADGGNTLINALGSGNVGIGTINPSAKLDVAGNIRENGQHVPSSEEDLRIIRGGGTANVTIDGINRPPLHGSGFTYKKIGQGVVDVTFNTPFAGTPTVTANPRSAGAIFCGLEGLGGGGNPGMTGFRIVMFDTSGSGRDWPFNFIAIGPR